MFYNQRRIPVNMADMVEQLASKARERINADDHRRFTNSPQGKKLAKLEAESEAAQKTLNEYRKSLGIETYGQTIPTEFVSEAKLAAIGEATLRFAERVVFLGKDQLAVAFEELKRELAA